MGWGWQEALRQRREAQLAPDLDIPRRNEGRDVRFGQAGTFYLRKTPAERHQGVLDLCLAKFPSVFQKRCHQTAKSGPP